MVWGYVFTAAAFVFWFFCARWAWKTDRYWLVALVMATAYCFMLESAMVRRGTYYYDVLLATDLGFGRGAAVLEDFTNLVDRVCRSGTAPTRIPFAIAMMEGVLLFSVVRTTTLLGLRWFVAPFLDAAASVNIDALLDPIVASAESCTKTSPAFTGLSFWVWRVPQHAHAGWFGIPYANYSAWFLAMFVFSLGVRAVDRKWNLEERGPITASVPTLRALTRAAVVALALIVLLAAATYVAHTGVRLLLDMEKGSAEWQASIVGTFLVASAIIVAKWGRPFYRGNRWCGEIVYPQLFIFALCLAALVHLWSTRSQLLLLVLNTTVVGTLFAVAPYALRPGGSAGSLMTAGGPVQ
jgi:hypothetical protein